LHAVKETKLDNPSEISKLLFKKESAQESESCRRLANL